MRSLATGERLDRRKETWPIFVGIRLTGLTLIACAVVWLWKPVYFGWASQPIPVPVRWIGVAGFAVSVAWLIWMYSTLGRNLTDTVAVRKNATFVDHGPYRFVRNPMYVGVLGAGVTLGIALGTLLFPVGAAIIFTLLAVRTRAEEEMLIERFGDRYRNYMARVGRFFPKLPSAI